MSTRPPGVMAKITVALKVAQGPVTMGELMILADITKTSAAEVSSALYKLRHQGKVKAIRAPSSAKAGPAFVMRYLWAQKAPAARPVNAREMAAVSPLQMLGIGRIG